MIKHFLTLLDYSEKEIRHLLDLAIKLKSGYVEEYLEGKTLAMLFEKPSTRTRVSFEVAMTQLKGHAIYLDFTTTQLSRGETIEDMAKVLSRYCNAIMARLYTHETLERLANASSVPVINGLTDRFHPCQTLGDLLTVMEKKGRTEDLKIVFMGDCGYNMFHSTMIGFSKLWANIVGCCPGKRDYMPDPQIYEKAKKYAKGSIRIEHDPEKAVKDADVIYTDTWVSMGQKNAEQRITDLKPYQVNKELLRHAKPEAIVMHCLPAHRGQEITSDVMDSGRSVIFDQAENRLHAQKAILLHLLKNTH
ncbi:MAG: ornithine carbamoyltransferase [Candidatus Aenigmarchaeota archaeon]|nr:ornithine carbamoyltransferase [Candidatus Aenigmarchaeota archaeon]